jgi:arginyl-tRNA synthetase
MLTEIKSKIARACESFFAEISCNSDFDLLSLFEIPKELAHGHLALPVFQLAKVKRKAPPLIAQELTEVLKSAQLNEVAAVQAVGGYVNITLKDSYVFQRLLEVVETEKDQLGSTKKYSGKTLIIDYSSPNVAKPMHIGHLRATVIGQALRNLAQTQGFQVIGVNHLGDWGSQFGKLCFAFEKWGKDFDFEKDAFESLYKLYVKFHEEAEKDPQMEAQGAAYFKRLEDGDPEMVKLWQKFIAISMADFDKNWRRLGVKHDLVRGESFYNDRMKPVEDELEAKGLLIESEGAMVVPMDEEGAPPCLIRKSDGASLYATRDLATAIYRMEELKADVNLYVVGSDQSLHFKQVFEVLRKMGKPWVKDCHHIGFGLVRFKDMGKISSRKGNIIRFSDVLDQAVQMVREVIKNKNPDLQGAEAEDVAEKVAVGAIIFNDLVNDRVKNVEFDWDRALSFEGDSGPYVQYVYVRCVGVLAKWGKTVPMQASALYTPDTEEERALIRQLLIFPDVLSSAYKYYKPNLVANYMLDVCGLFNRFYHNHKILNGPEELKGSRLALVKATQAVIRQGLWALNMPVPEKM